MCGGPLLQLPLLPLGYEYSSVSQPGVPPPPAWPRSITEAVCVTVFRAVEWVRAGWRDWLGLTDTTGRFRRG